MLYQEQDTAQDFLHDLFVKLIDKSKYYNSEKKFSTWIYSIASNMCKNEYRRRNIRNNIINEDYDIELVSWDDDYINFNMDKVVFIENLEKELQEMSYNHKTVFILRYKEELSISEIAYITEISEGTVKSRLFYSTKKLTDKLKNYKPEVGGY